MLTLETVFRFVHEQTELFSGYNFGTNQKGVLLLWNAPLVNTCNTNSGRICTISDNRVAMCRNICHFTPSQSHLAPSLRVILRELP